jgi:hypothetical protein
MYRQGDVLIVPVAKLPAKSKLTEVPREEGRVVLAHGEVTGHSHAFARGGVEMYRTETDARFMRVGGSASIDATRQAEAYNLAIRFADLASARSLADRAEADGLAALRHEEHKPVIHAPGAYQVIIQREYAPGAIRNVAD